MSLVDGEADSVAPLETLRRGDWVGLAVCVAFGIAMATLPHLRAWWFDGNPSWIADNDEVFYLQVGSQAYFNHPFRLGDPVRSDQGHSIYKPLPLLPGVLIARALGAGPLAIGPAWRLWSGLTIGAAWLLFSRRFLANGSIWIASAFALIVLADGGLIEGRPLVRQGLNTLKSVANDEGLFQGKPNLHPEWRISTPGVTMAYLLLLLWALHRAVERPTKLNILTAGAAYGLLFHVYFYYWTAASIALAAAFVLDARGRRAYFGTTLVGLLVGAPSLVADVATKRTTAPDWLLRSDKFLPIGRFAELQIPLVALAALAVSGYFVRRNRRDLVFLWCLAFSGLCLMNHQVATAMQLENFHWSYAWGPCLSALLLVLVVDGLATRYGTTRWFAPVLVGAALLFAASGLWTRAIEAGRSFDCLDLGRDLKHFQDWSARAGWEELVAARRDRPTVSGRPSFVNFAAILGNCAPLEGYAVTLSSSVKNEEWDERKALSAALQGWSRDQFLKSQRHELETEPWGPWGRNRDAARRAERLERRMAAFDRFQQADEGRLDRWRVAYFLSDAERGPAIGTGWTRSGGVFVRPVPISR